MDRGVIISTVLCELWCIAQILAHAMFSFFAFTSWSPSFFTYSWSWSPDVKRAQWFSSVTTTTNIFFLFVSRVVVKRRTHRLLAHRASSRCVGRKMRIFFLLVYIACEVAGIYIYTRVAVYISSGGG